MNESLIFIVKIRDSYFSELSSNFLNSYVII